MPTLTLPDLIGLLGVSIVGSLVVFWLINKFHQITKQSPSHALPAPISNAFLFDGAVLIDHDIGEMPAYMEALDTFSEWPHVRKWLASRFDDLPENLSDLSEDEQHRYESRACAVLSELQIRRSGTITRVTITDHSPPLPALWHNADYAAQSSRQTRAMLDHAPFPIWETDVSGQVIWHNTKFRLIRDHLQDLQDSLANIESDSTLPRFSVPSVNEKDPCWYEVSAHQIGRDTLYFATEINAVVDAECAQRNFLQTLTKTFANLTTGLAVFDSNRRLALFNPALVDLTGLEAPFLSARPDVIHFFDELRERQVLPEPKNYANWRAQIRDVISKANEGFYQETWNLPGGMTYRVTGRPHPDGAIAFLIDDISAEIRQTRQYRSQIDLGQAVIAGLDDAIMVIAPNDVVLMCNPACSRLIGIDPDSCFADISVQDVVVTCRSRFDEGKGLERFADGLTQPVAQADGIGSGQLYTKQGHLVTFQIKALRGGTRLVCFKQDVDATNTLSEAAAE